MKWLDKLYIKQKLTIVILMIVTVALLLAGAGLIVVDQLTYKRLLSRNLGMMAEIAGNHCAVPLLFDHVDDARESLSILLEAHDHINYACLYDRNDKIFARYKRSGVDTQDLPLIPDENSTSIIGNHMVSFRQIDVDGEKIGKVYIQSDLGEIYARLKQYALIAVIVLFISFVASFILASKLQHVISRPILHLATFVRNISLTQDFSLRVEKHTQDEIGFLSDRFNEMLVTIEDKSGALQSAHDELKKRAKQLQKELTIRKRAEKQIKHTLNEKEILLKEIHHRVKNNLQVISSLLYFQSKKSNDDRTLEMFNESRNRVRSMALLHEKLYQAEDIGNIDFSDYVRSLTRFLHETYSVEAERAQIDVDVDDIQIGIENAISCGLIINELVSNALKYAFPDEKTGRISVKLRKDVDDDIILIVKDDGVGFPDSFELGKTDTLGMQLVYNLSQRLRGTVEHKNTHGTQFTIRFKQRKAVSRSAVNNV